MPNYVLVTAARNEEEFIQKTLDSVVAQEKKPLRWIIVSDGSTDRTDEIVRHYQAQHDWISLHSTAQDQERNFGSKAKAVNFGYAQVKDLDFQFAGNLDADVSFDPQYYGSLLELFAQNTDLGLAGGSRFDFFQGKFHKVHCARNSVGGPFQLFRREAFEKIGGYQVLPCGGIDAVAETMVRMHGWRVRTFSDLHVYHHRTTGTAKDNLLQARFREGQKQYMLGYHPLFLLVQSTFRALKKSTFSKRRFPLASVYRVSGYFWALLRRAERPVSQEFVKYLRSEQMVRLRTLLFTRKDPALQDDAA